MLQLGERQMRVRIPGASLATSNYKQGVQMVDPRIIRKNAAAEARMGSKKRPNPQQAPVCCIQSLLVGYVAEAKFNSRNYKEQ